MRSNCRPIFETNIVSGWLMAISIKILQIVNIFWMAESMLHADWGAILNVRTMMVPNTLKHHSLTR